MGLLEELGQTVLDQSPAIHPARAVPVWSRGNVAGVAAVPLTPGVWNTAGSAIH